jgi:hypothetical protein
MSSENNDTVTPVDSTSVTSPAVNNITVTQNGPSSQPKVPSIPDITEDPETMKFMQSYLTKLEELNSKDFELASNLKEVVRNLDNSLKAFENLSMDEMYEISGHVTKHSPNNFILLHIVGVITGQQFQKTKTA